MTKVQKSKLAEALSASFSIIGSKPVLPVLSMSLLVIDGDKLYATGSSGAAYITKTVSIEKTDSLQVCVPTQLLKVLNALPEQEVTLSFDGKSVLTLTHASGRALFEAEPESSYNLVPKLPEEKILEIPSNILKDLVHTVLPFRPKISESDVWNNHIYVSDILGRPSALCGSMHNICAAFFDADLKGGLTLTPGIVSAIGELPYNEPVSFFKDSRFMHISCAGMVASEVMTTVAWPVAGTTNIMGVQPTHKVEVDTALIRNAIKRLSLCSTSDMDLMEMRAEDDVFKIEFASGYEEVPCVGELPPFNMKWQTFLPALGEKCTIATSAELAVPVFVIGDDFKSVNTKLIKL